LGFHEFYWFPLVVCLLALWYCSGVGVSNLLLVLPYLLGVLPRWSYALFPFDGSFVGMVCAVQSGLIVWLPEFCGHGIALVCLSSRTPWLR
jgi:hypothetical protein